MSFRSMLAAVTAGFLVMASSGAAKQPSVDPLGRIFPADRYEVSAQFDELKNEDRIYRSITIRSDKLDIAIDRLTFSLMATNEFAVKADRLILRSRDKAGFAVSLDGLYLVLAGWPNHATTDRLCNWLQITNVLSVDEVRAVDEKRSTDRLALRSLAIENIEFSASKGRSGCWLDGQVAVDKLEAGIGQKAIIQADGLRSRIRLPMSVSAARLSQHPRSDLELTALSAAYLLSEDKMVAAGSNLAASISAYSQSLIGLVHTLRNASFPSRENTGLLTLMQSFNALTLARAHLDFSFPDARIFSARILPGQALASFSDVNLLRLTGDAKVTANFNSGRYRIDGQSHLNGLFDMTIQAAGALTPYSKESLLRVAKFQEADTPNPEVSIAKLRLDYLDLGLNEAFNLLFGAPPGRYIEASTESVRNDWPEERRHALSLLADGLAIFFRSAATGLPVTMTAEHAAGLTPASLFSQFTAHPDKLKSKLNLSFRVNEK